MLVRRLKETFAARQTPADRLWAVVLVLSLLVVLIGAIVIESRIYTQGSRELDYGRGAIDCLSVLVDEDRSFGTPPYCRLNEVVVYYPPAVCEEFFPQVAFCGYKWE